MRKSALLLLWIISGGLYSQSQELNLGLGFAYYYGDLNTSNLENSPLTLFGESLDMKNFKLSYSLAYRYNFKNRFSLGVNFYHLYLSGYDSDNLTTSPSDVSYYRKIRNLSFHTAVNQCFVDLRVEPFRTEKKWLSKKMLLSPYVGAGIGFFQFNPKAIYNGQEVELQPLGTEGQGLPGYASKYRLVELAIPVNMGLKVYFPSRRVALALDFAYNHTFTDYIDDVSTVYPDPVDFQTAYAADPVKYNLAIALADPGLIQHAVGEIRGHENKDFFLTGQLKFIFVIPNLSSNYYGCYQY